MILTYLYRGLPSYPDRLTELLGDWAPPRLTVSGNLSLLQRSRNLRQRKIFSPRAIALFSSQECPPAIARSTLELVDSLFRQEILWVGGFHSALEQAVLNRILGSEQPLILCLARALESRRLPASWQKALAAERLLMVSPISEKKSRPSVETVRVRNQLVAALADEVLVAYAAPNGKTERFCQTLLIRGQRVLALDCPENDTLIKSGAMPIRADASAAIGR